MVESNLSSFRALIVRRPWIVPLAVLLALTALSLLDPRRPRELAAARPARGALEVLGAIEPHPDHPVRSIVRIQWSTVPGTSDYEVRFYSMDMREVARHRANTSNSFSLDLREVWKPVAPARAILWRVVALRNGEDLALSPLQTLRLP